jgi:hypothetical protein
MPGYACARMAIIPTPNPPTPPHKGEGSAAALLS